ncbi:MAG: nucleotide exchange factor GrpE [Oscillospiraceae bacterium]|jgi:molecular chaperone GrpE|nr:nucleotide exchange factor GrpE [Oscillospiraceae bacterium]
MSKKDIPEEEILEEEALELEDAEATDLIASELEKTRDMLLRTLAEYDNFRKRTAKEKDDLISNSKAFAVAELLPILDSLENALKLPEGASAADIAESLLKGMELTYRQAVSAFEKLGVEEISGLGEPFNPEEQNAVAHIESDEFDENTVSLVMQKGYRIGEKVIRHAMVQVAN